nr:MAG TPA: hypothetical protein [Caudoviricetes sp.]
MLQAVGVKIPRLRILIPSLGRFFSRVGNFVPTVREKLGHASR